MNKQMLLVAAAISATVISAEAQISVFSAVGGVPAGNLSSLTLYNFDTNTVTATGSGNYTVNAYSLDGPAATLSLSNAAGLVTGSSSGQWAAPYFSGNTASIFGETPLSGQDSSQYVAVRSGGTAVLSFGNVQLHYLGVLWGSVDSYNSLSFYNGATLLGSITGSQVTAAANGSQGADGTFFVNINSTQAFTSVQATSSQNSFEFDDVAVSASAQSVPEPGVSALLALGGLGGAWMLRRRVVNA